MQTSSVFDKAPGFDNNQDLLADQNLMMYYVPRKEGILICRLLIHNIVAISHDMYKILFVIDMSYHVIDMAVV